MPEENNQTPLSFGVFVRPSNGEITINLLHRQDQNHVEPFQGENGACNSLAQKINRSLETSEIQSNFTVENPQTDVGKGVYISCTTFVGFQDFTYGTESLGDRPAYNKALESAEAMCSRLNALQITVGKAEFANAVRAR